MEAALVFWSRYGTGMARVAPFAIYILFLALKPVVAKSFPEADIRWLYALQIGATAMALAVLRRQYVELAGAFALRAGQWLLAVVVGVMVFVAWINLDLPWLALGGTGGGGFDPSAPDGTLDWSLIVVRIAGAALVVPLMEELFWRSLVMRWIDQGDFLRLAPAATSLRAWLVSSLVFGFEHDLWFAGIFAGVAYGWLYRRGGNLWLPIAGHAVTNLLLGVWVVATGSWRFW